MIRAHRSVLLEAAVNALAIRPDGTYVDATFGRGGHARGILARLGTRGRLVALDRDPEAAAAARDLADARFVFFQERFSALPQVLAAARIATIDGLLLDLGVSSPQLDDPARGFSFRSEGPLDMRMDPGQGVSAAEWLSVVDERELREVIAEYGEER